jgi:hypothetical protein
LIKLGQKQGNETFFGNKTVDGAGIKNDYKLGITADIKKG